MVIFYGIKNCDIIKKVCCWLEANNIDYCFYDYCVDGLDSELLNDFINELGWEVLFNICGIIWCKLDEIICNKIIDVVFVVVLMIEMFVIIKCLLFCVFGKFMLLGFSDFSYQ